MSSLEGSISIKQSLMGEVSNGVVHIGGMTSESEATVPSYVKNIKESDIENWNSKATIEDMTTYIEEHKEELKGADGKDGAKGEQGEKGTDGKTPVKGTDYYTEVDKQEMINSVIEALPKYNGGVS